MDINGNVISGTYSTNVPAVLAGGESIVLSRNGNEVVIYDATNTTSGASVYGEPTAYTLSFWVNFQDLSLESVHPRSHRQQRTNQRLLARGSDAAHRPVRVLALLHRGRP